MTTVPPTLVLSSSSPARRELLTRLQLPFISTTPDIDETPLPNETTEALVARLALEKAQKVAKDYQEALIIGCDQVGILENEILCKPLSHERACEQLQKMSGKKIIFYIGICLLDAKNNSHQVAVEQYDVYFRNITHQEIEAYLLKEQPYQCAGSLQIEGLGIAFIEKLSGSDYTALVGLPLIRLTTMLKAVGVKVIG